MLLKYLGYNGNYAQFEFDVKMDDPDETKEICLELKKIAIPDSQIFSSDKVYCEFSTRYGDVTNCIIPRADKLYIAKWRGTQIFLSMLFFVFCCID